MAGITALRTSANEYISKRSVFTKADLFWLLPFLAIAVFPVYWQITALPILLWDEARQAINAAEMVENGNLIVTYFQGLPDMWNTKPPLQIWLMALSINVLGYSEFAIRFPTTLAVLGTFGLLFWFGIRGFNSKLVAVLSVLVLVSSQGYMTFHIARNADYDALLVFFVTLYTLTIYLYLETGKPKYWWCCVAGLTLAVLTKSVAGLMCAPALLMYVLLRGKLLLLLKQKRFYAGLACFVFFIAGYYLLREQMNPGYLKQVYENELGGRYLNTIEQHLHPWYWYLEMMREQGFIPWLYLMPVAVWVLAWHSNARVKCFLLLTILYLVIYMAIISAAQTKLIWYVAPLYPMAAIIVSLGIWVMIQAIGSFMSAGRKAIFTGFTVLFIFVFPYYRVLNSYLVTKAEAPRVYWESMLGSMLKALSEKHPEEKQLVLFQKSDQYPAVSHYYKIAYKKKGYRFREIHQLNFLNLKPGAVVVVVDKDLHPKIVENFKVEIVHAFHSAITYRILEKKINIKS